MKVLQNMKVGRRLALGFGLLLALSILITVIGVMKLAAVGQASREMMALPLIKERLISDWSKNISNAVLRTTIYGPGGTAAAPSTNLGNISGRLAFAGTDRKSVV